MPRPSPSRPVRSSQHLLDVIYLLSASRNVANKHARLRSQQWQIFRKSSAPTREVEDQIRSMVDGVRAAVALGKRFLEDSVDTSASNRYKEYQNTSDNEPTIHQRPIKCNTTAKVAIDIDDPPLDVNLDVFRTKKVAQSLSPESQTDKHKNSFEEMLRKDSSISNTTSIPEQPLVRNEIIPPPSIDSNSAFQMKESRVPSSRFGRLWQYGGLATSMAFGAVGESLRRATGTSSEGSLMLGPKNIERLVAKLSRMRGAALKLGQMISFQDSKMLPPEINEILQRVQDSADYMPPSQRDQVLAENLGSDWRSLFSRFDDVPIAAASIGQVHRAVFAPTGQEVAVKVQYPGVARSIDSDLNNLSVLLTASRLLPKGLFLDRTIANARTELAWECDYEREATAATKFANLLQGDNAFSVPQIFSEASGKSVLTATYMRGVGVTKLPHLTQDQRDWIGSQILRLCLREITEFSFMQTDPNWTNFLFNATSQKIELLDFGASREYPPQFIDPYVSILRAASIGDSETIATQSVALGYLTGHESNLMRDAHVQSVLTLAEPFSNTAPEVYDFRGQTITDRVRELIPIMLKERLAPPPEETYSLHRKLSGAFLLCAKLGSRVKGREMWDEAMRRYDDLRKGNVR